MKYINNKLKHRALKTELLFQLADFENAIKVNYLNPDSLLKI